ncbi:hypothetical protein [Ureibacillus manganicus]|uniref:Uncharacterized protein n=1 Tax=Ureibacillus manganicus DSM 26584 TaxID=1384049 RepID=A0A0A3I400_9BACL|nr:hypothetical protein [Ureibacillus manganicus]KGR77388.1 hypothetical protein CD29_15075 [Ureibacillus manganicus DSM 26584]
MKLYWILVAVFYFCWIQLSHKYDDISWWSIFTSNRSTHTPLMEELSLVKVTLTAIIFLGLAYFLNRMHQKKKN